MRWNKRNYTEGKKVFGMILMDLNEGNGIIRKGIKLTT
jgi:hypothetical protein